jgi:hypothetical protein
MSRGEKKPARAFKSAGIPLEPPVFCEQCPNLALAVLDESPLCRNCTLAAVEGRAPRWIEEHTRPLELIPLATPIPGGEDTSSGEVA